MTVFVIGEVLIDRLPEGDRAGGAPFNVACHLKQFGVPVRLITRVGDDADGRRLHRMLMRRGFEAADMQIDPDHGTGIVDVALDAAGLPAFSIREDVAYDHLALGSLPHDPAWPLSRLIYFGSLIQRERHGGDQLGALLARRPAGAACFCDINLRPPHCSTQTVTRCLRFADILKLNEDELEEIRLLLGKPAGAASFAEYLMDRQGLSLIAMTRGAAGSTIFHGEGRIDTPGRPAAAVADTVGAGDAFAAVLAVGVLRGLPLDRVAATAGDVAAGICGISGAVPDDPGFYDEWKNALGDV